MTGVQTCALPILGLAFVPARKRGKLPGATIGRDYALEYGADRLEIHQDAIGQRDRILIVDDLLATGGTAAATVLLVRSTGAEVAECAFVVDLPDLGGRERLHDYNVLSLVAYD